MKTEVWYIVWYIVWEKWIPCFYGGSFLVWNLCSSSLVYTNLESETQPVRLLLRSHSKNKLIPIWWLVYILSGFVFLPFVASHNVGFLAVETHTNNLFLYLPCHSLFRAITSKYKRETNWSHLLINVKHMPKPTTKGILEGIWGFVCLF